MSYLDLVLHVLRVIHDNPQVSTSQCSFERPKFRSSNTNRLKLP